jgi:hypothetical protein
VIAAIEISKLVKADGLAELCIKTLQFQPGNIFYPMKFGNLFYSLFFKYAKNLFYSFLDIPYTCSFSASTDEDCGWSFCATPSAALFLFSGSNFNNAKIVAVIRGGCVVDNNG